MSCTNPNHWYLKSLKSHWQLNDNVFTDRFETGKFPPSLFTHEAHLRLAWIYLDMFDENSAIEKTCRGIQHFDSLHGKGDKYNATVTVAAVKVVNHFKQKSKSHNFKAFIEEFPRLKNAFKALLDFHYGFDIFNSEVARRTYLEPDLLPFT